MPIQDWNGTTASEIKTLQDWDGTAAHKIGKVDDWDGTANHLIYSAEENILSKFSASDYYAPNGSYQAASINSDGSLQFNATEYILRNIWTPAIDLSQWNTLTITYAVTKSTANSGNNAQRGITIMANATNVMSWSIESPNTAYSAYFKYVYGNDQVTAGKTYTQTVDISSWTGNQKIGLSVLCGAGNTLTLKVTSVILS